MFAEYYRFTSIGDVADAVRDGWTPVQGHQPTHHDHYGLTMGWFHRDRVPPSRWFSGRQSRQDALTVAGIDREAVDDGVFQP